MLSSGDVMLMLCVDLVMRCVFFSMLVIVVCIEKFVVMSLLSFICDMLFVIGLVFSMLVKCVRLILWCCVKCVVLVRFVIIVIRNRLMVSFIVSVDGMLLYMKLLWYSGFMSVWMVLMLFGVLVSIMMS